MRANGYRRGLEVHEGDMTAAAAQARRREQRVHIEWSPNGRWSFDRDPREDWQK